MAALRHTLEEAGAGHGQVVAVVGEAGVGKSRLVYEGVDAHHTQGWRVLESASVSYGKATPYFPVVDLLKRYTHIEDTDEPRTVRAKVTGQVLTLDETLQGDNSGPSLAARRSARRQPLPHARAPTAAPAHPRGTQACAAAREPGTAAAASV